MTVELYTLRVCQFWFHEQSSNPGKDYDDRDTVTLCMETLFVPKNA